MRINVISDLHLEFEDLVLPGGDVLILSGDVCEAKHLKQDTTDTNRYNRFFNEELPKYNKVFYVVGNHEHYGFKFNNTVNHIKKQMPDNTTVLEKSAEEYEGVVFVGGTLWTDINGNDPITSMVLRQNLNDYRVITNYYTDTGSYYKLTPEFTYDEHKSTVEFISDTIKANPSRDIVVITHHSPSKSSTKPKYQNDYHMNGGYSSDLDSFILDHPQIRLWTHGHTHDVFDYMIGDTRIMCNPRGYVGYETRPNQFDPTLGMDLIRN